MSVTEELEAIRKQCNGVLRAEDVVEYARRHRDSALNERFVWDDTKAAREYRLWQAREIIRVEVTIIPHANVETRAYVSLLSDRNQEGGGYRRAVDVLSRKPMREEWLDQALAELNVWKAKYQLLAKELAPVFEAMEKAGKGKATPQKAMLVAASM